MTNATYHFILSAFLSQVEKAVCASVLTREASKRRLITTVGQCRDNYMQAVEIVATGLVSELEADDAPNFGDLTPTNILGRLLGALEYILEKEKEIV